jgi:hypothetical protein
VGAAALRLTGLWSDLWLDELWSRRVAIAMKSPWDAFTLHHEINHHLSTVWLYLSGPDASAAMYRLPSYVCGVAAVAVAGLIGRRRSSVTGLLAMLLAATSYELVLFSSEARGYSMAVLCTLVSFLVLDDQLKRPRWTSAVGFSVTAAAGLFSHPVFSTVLAAACVWCAIEWLRASPRSPRSALERLGPLALPLAALAALYFGDLRYIVSGGGTTTPSLIDAYGQGLAWALGTPDTAALKLATCILAVVAIVAGLRQERGAHGSVWLFFFAAIVIFPNLAVMLRGSEIVYPRHFLLAGVLVLMLLSFVLGSWWDRGGRWRAGAAVAVLAFLVTNGLHVRTLAERGRGQYQEAIRFMAERTAGPLMSIGGDQDFRLNIELEYYLPRVLGSRSARYYTDGTWPPGGPIWLLANADHYEPPLLPHNIYTDKAGNEFEWVRTFPTAPLSGLHWFVFKNRRAK